MAETSFGSRGATPGKDKLRFPSTIVNDLITRMLWNKGLSREDIEGVLSRRITPSEASAALNERYVDMINNNAEGGVPRKKKSSDNSVGESTGGDKGSATDAALKKIRDLLYPSREIVGEEMPVTSQAIRTSELKLTMEEMRVLAKKMGLAVVPQDPAQAIAQLESELATHRSEDTTQPVTVKPVRLIEGTR